MQTGDKTLYDEPGAQIEFIELRYELFGKILPFLLFYDNQYYLTYLLMRPNERVRHAKREHGVICCGWTRR